MTSEDIIKKTHQVMIEEFEVEEGKLNPEATLFEELDLDSLDAIDLIVALESAFTVKIEEKRAKEMRTMQDIYDYIKELN